MPSPWVESWLEAAGVRTTFVQAAVGVWPCLVGGATAAGVYPIPDVAHDVQLPLMIHAHRLAEMRSTAALSASGGDLPQPAADVRLSPLRIGCVWAKRWLRLQSGCGCGWMGGPRLPGMRMIVSVVVDR
jgi:hypothetical protein